jgi:hypothetical protein
VDLHAASCCFPVVDDSRRLSEALDPGEEHRAVDVARAAAARNNGEHHRGGTDDRARSHHARYVAGTIIRHDRTTRAFEIH